MRSSVEVGATSWIRAELGPGARGGVGDDEACRACCPGVRLEALPTVCLEQRRVGHRDQRRVADEGAGRGEALEAGGRAHPRSERLLGGGTDHRAVGERVGEREADLDDVGATRDGGRGEGRGVLAGHEVDDERLAHVGCSDPGDRLQPVTMAAVTGFRPLLTTPAPTPPAPRRDPCRRGPRGRRRRTPRRSSRRPRERATTRARE